MSSFEQKDNSGSLFKNDRREKDSQPNATGKAMIGGRMYYVNAWTKTKADGERWQSLSFKPIEEKGPGKAPAGGYAQELNDDVPW